MLVGMSIIYTDLVKSKGIIFLYREVKRFIH